MPHRQITLQQFQFPEDLSNGKANFRLIVDVRLYDAETQHLSTEHAVLPSLDTFWECDTGRADKPNYVRAANAHEVDMDALDDWDKLILVVSDNHRIYGIQFKVIDVDRVDAWDKIKNYLGNVAKIALKILRAGIEDGIPNVLTGPFGQAAADIESFVLKKMAGGDKVLFRSATEFNGEEDGITGVAEGSGSEGQYRIEVLIEGVDIDDISV